MHDTIPDSPPEQDPHIEVWNDLISVKDLLVSLVITAATGVIALVLASAVGGQPLFWGLGGCVLGFLISCAVVPPKREVLIIEDEHGEQPAGAQKEAVR